MTTREVSVIVVSYNARNVLERCLSALDAERFEVIVVDNASADGSPDLVRDRFPEMTLLDAGGNVGFGAANNLGMQRAGGRYVALVNSDAWAVDDGLDVLVEFAKRDPRHGIVGPRLLNEDGTVQQSVRGFPTVWRLCTEYFFLRKLARSSRTFNAFYGGGFDYATVRDADWLMGAALVVRRELIDEVGGFDERFFLFSEEVDLCLRIRQAGWEIRHMPQVTILHHFGKAGVDNRLVAQEAYARRLYMEKHFSRLGRFVGTAGLGLGYTLRAVTGGGTRNPARRAAARRALAVLAGRTPPPFGSPPGQAVRPRSS